MKIAVTPHKAFLPVCQLLAQQNVRFWGATPDWTQAMIDIDLPAQPLAKMLDGEDSDRAWTHATRMIIAGSQPFQQNGLVDSVYSFMQDKAMAFLGPRVFDLCAMVLALDKAQPDLVLVHNDVEPRTRAMALWSRTRGAPCLHVPHAVYQDVNREDAGTDVHDLITASHLAVAGPVQREWYETRGMLPEAIKETGLPQWDHWSQPSPIDRQRARRQLRLSPESTVITYCSTWPQHTNLLGVNDQWIWAYRSFLWAVKQLPNVEVIIKLHPHAGQQSHQWHAQEAKLAGVGVSLTAEHLPNCLWASDLLIAFGGSNVIIEGSHLGHLRLMSTHGYKNEPVVSPAPLDPDGMLEAIKDSLSRDVPNASAFRHRWAGEADGHATERVANYVMELLHG